MSPLCILKRKDNNELLMRNSRQQPFPYIYTLKISPPAVSPLIWTGITWWNAGRCVASHSAMVQLSLKEAFFIKNATSKRIGVEVEWGFTGLHAGV
jgi:hypothetical protein